MVHLATVCSHQQHNRPHDVTGSCLIGLHPVVGSRKLMCVEVISPALGFPVGWLLSMFFKAEIISFVAQLNHSPLDASMYLYRVEQKHWGFGSYWLWSCILSISAMCLRLEEDGRVA
jgi:hypothetical protein